jgi:UDP-N-acetylglucosamine 4,6-dehydratase/5-epimerase
MDGPCPKVPIDRPRPVRRPAPNLHADRLLCATIAQSDTSPVGSSAQANSYSESMFTDRVLLITGGTGSFGHAVLRRFLKTPIREIRILSRDEKKQEDMRLEYNDAKLTFYIGDVRDYNSVVAAVQGVDYVFHAAALKQVPSCEFFPLEAIMTNALGAENVLTASVANGVKRVIVLSTDKAVYPINAMGLSKAMMEKLMLAKARRTPPAGPIMCGTRYGNVMGSRGSVIPLFIQQIKQHVPLTVTDPNMTRFLMSMEDAVDLVLYAFGNGEAGDILVQKAPAATIETLALALMKLFRATNGLRIIGTRHGEKLYETLLTREERARAQDLGTYFRVPADCRDLNYSAYFTQGQQSVSHQEDYHSHNTRRLNVDETLALLAEQEVVREQLCSWVPSHVGMSR